MNRRRMLKVLLCAAGAALETVSLPLRGATADCFPMLAADIDESAIHELGAEYLAEHAGGAAVEALLSLVRAAPGTDEEVIAKLRAMTKRDYAEGRTVQLAGWWVSRTEACIFAAISACVHSVGVERR